MKLLIARTEDEIRSRPDQRDPVLWLGTQAAPESIRSRTVPLPPDPTALEGWLAIRRLGDELVGGQTVKNAFAYRDVSLWWFLHYWIVYGHGFTGWDERYRTLVRVLAGLAAAPDELVLLSGRADDDAVVRAVAVERGLPYRWEIPAWSRGRRRFVLRWGAEVLFRVRMLKLILRGFVARRINRNTLEGRGAVALLFNASSSTWDARHGTDRVLGPVIDEAGRAGLTVAGLHLDHRRNLGLDTLRLLDRRIVAWESLVTPRVALRAMSEGRKVARRFGGSLPGRVLGIPASSLLADRLPVLFRVRLADSILAIETCREAMARMKPRCVYIVDAYDLWGRALVVAARQAGIRSVELQHGIIEESHDGYLHLEGEVSPDLDQKTPFSPIPDVIVVHGEAAKQALIVHGRYPERAIEVTGSPQIEAIRKSKENRVEARQKLGLGEEGLVGLFFGAPYHVFPADEDHLRAFMACCRRLPAIKPLLRPHPAEYNPARYHAAARDAGVEALVLTEANPFEMIVASDLVISHNSTTALDAMVLHRPVIHVNMSGTPDLFPFVEEGGALRARSETELFDALTALMDPQVRTAQALRHEPYAGRYYAHCPDPAKAMLRAGLPDLVPA